MTKEIVASRNFANASGTDLDIKREAIGCIYMGENTGQFRNRINK
jgi:hypothetical protein